MLVHGLDRGQILVHHGLKGAAPLLHVPQAAAEDADVGIGFHEDLDVEHLPQGGILENQDPLHDDDLGGINGHGLVRAVVVLVGVDRALYGMTGLQLPQVFDQQLRVEGTGVVIVDLGPLLITFAELPLVIAVVANDRHILAEMLLQMPGKGGFTGAGAAGNADENRAHLPKSSSICPQGRNKTACSFVYYNKAARPKARVADLLREISRNFGGRLDGVEESRYYVNCKMLIRRGGRLWP